MRLNPLRKHFMIEFIDVFMQSMCQFRTKWMQNSQEISSRSMALNALHPWYSAAQPTCQCFLYQDMSTDGFCHISQGLSKKHDISSEDNEVVKAGKEHLIKCLEVKMVLLNRIHSCVDCPQWLPDLAYDITKLSTSIGT